MLQVSVYAGDLAETQYHCNGIPLALSEGMGPEANLPETSRRECKYLSVILASQPGFSGCCRVCQCTATPRQGIKTDFEVFVRYLRRFFPPSLASAGHMCWISEEVTAWSVTLQVSPSVQQTGILTLQCSHETAQHECFLSVQCASSQMKQSLAKKGKNYIPLHLLYVNMV